MHFMATCRKSCLKSILRMRTRKNVLALVHILKEDVFTCHVSREKAFRMKTDVFGKHNSVSDDGGSACKSNKEPNRVANVNISLNSNSIRDWLQYCGEMCTFITFGCNARY